MKKLEFFYFILMNVKSVDIRHDVATLIDLSRALIRCVLLANNKLKTNNPSQIQKLNQTKPNPNPNDRNFSQESNKQNQTST